MFIEVLLIVSASLFLINRANDELFIVCMCLALGIQNGALDKTNGISVHSTYMTGMVTTLMQRLRPPFFKGESSRRLCKTIGSPCYPSFGKDVDQFYFWCCYRRCDCFMLPHHWSVGRRVAANPVNIRRNEEASLRVRGGRLRAPASLRGECIGEEPASSF